MDTSTSTSPPSPPPVLHLPPPHSSSTTTSFPVIAIAVIGILATAFLLVSYYIFVIKCCLTWHRVDVFNRFFSRVRDTSDEAPLPTTTLASSNSDSQKGLDEALIRSIPVIEFRKLTEERRKINDTTSQAAAAAAAAAESYECAVCLSEFVEGDKLRVIPYCCHAFHIDCIDVWLQSNANCPLCRLGISPSSILYNNNTLQQQQQNYLINHSPQSQLQKDGDDDDDNNNDIDDDDDDGYVVIEIQGNNLDEPRMVRRESKGRKKLGDVRSIGDEMIDMRKRDEEFNNIIVPVRRSVSMDMSSDREFWIEIQECGMIRNCNVDESEISCNNNNNNNNNNYSKVRRSIFSFGYGRG